MSRDNSDADLAIAKLYLRPDQKGLLHRHATAVRKRLITDQMAAWAIIISVGTSLSTYFYARKYILVTTVCAFWVTGVPLFFLRKR